MRSPVSSLIGLILLAALPQSAGKNAPLPTKSEHSDPFARTVPTITLHDQTVFEAIAELYESTGIVVSVERVLGMQQATAMDRKFTATITSGKPTAVLNEITALDSRYTWLRDGNVINIYPRSLKSDPQYLFNRRIPTFRLMAVKSAADAAILAADQVSGVRPLLIVLKTGAVTFKKPWTAMFHDITLRQAINRAAQHLCAGCGWQLSGTKSTPTVIFYRRLLPDTAKPRNGQ